MLQTFIVVSFVESGNLLIKICSPIGLISAESSANFMAE